MSSHIIIFGPQGSGKGTQADVLAREHNLEHISTGNIFREAIAQKTELGQQVESLINKGQLVPDDLVNDLVAEKLINLEQADKGYVLDGYPRTLSQAAFLSAYTIDAALLVDISDEEALARIQSRITCVCGATYNTITNPPQQEGVCDNCGKALKRRDDESEAAVKQRLALYHEQTGPLVAYYENKGLLHRINGEQPISAVAKDIKQALEL